MSLYRAVFLAAACRGRATRDDFKNRTHWATSEALTLGRAQRQPDELLCRRGPRHDEDFIEARVWDDDPGLVVDCPRCLEVAARLGLG